MMEMGDVPYRSTICRISRLWIFNLEKFIVILRSSKCDPKTELPEFCVGDVFIWEVAPSRKKGLQLLDTQNVTPLGATIPTRHRLSPKIKIDGVRENWPGVPCFARDHSIQGHGSVMQLGSSFLRSATSLSAGTEMRSWSRPALPNCRWRGWNIGNPFQHMTDVLKELAESAMQTKQNKTKQEQTAVTTVRCKVNRIRVLNV